jgi:hypothetical protein
MLLTAYKKQLMLEPAKRRRKTEESENQETGHLKKRENPIGEGIQTFT